MKYQFIYRTPDEDDQGTQRLDRFLVSQVPDHTRSMIAKLIDQGVVVVNSTPAKKAGHALRDGDVVDVEVVVKTIDESQARKLDLDIIDEQPDFLIINKPAGLLVHQAISSGDEISLVNGLLYHFKEFEQFDDTQRPGIVHRLDKNTSGLIVVARNQQAQAALSLLFKDREVNKTYLAIVNGHPDRSGTIDFPIGRHPSKRHKMSHAGFASRAAKTHFDVLVYYKEATLVQARPVTGRTHQIRVHLAAIGHGLLGDTMYGQTSRHISRHALHAWKLAFTYQGREYSYCVPVPDDMKKLLKAEVASGIEG